MTVDEKSVDEDPNDDLAQRDLIAVLTRWQDAGAIWQVVVHSGSRATVALLRCDGGEEVERLTTAHPGTLRFLAGRSSSQDASSQDSSSPDSGGQDSSGQEGSVQAG